MNAATLMDKQYRYQRYIYDWSRKYYLFGRDRILQQISLQDDETLLEIGCGTARNLELLHQQYKHHKLYGIDASQAMLDIAEKKLTGKQAKNIKLRQGLADDFNYQAFDLKKPFDHILFSYVLSMIPDWQTALDNALLNLKAGGELHIVDFSDQGKIPTGLKKALRIWLGWFHVQPNTEILDRLKDDEKKGKGKLQVQHIFGRYAYLVKYIKT